MAKRDARIRRTCKFGYGGYVFEIRYDGTNVTELYKTAIARRQTVCLLVARANGGGIGVAYMIISPDINERIVWRLFWGSSIIEETL